MTSKYVLMVHTQVEKKEFESFNEDKQNRYRFFSTIVKFYYINIQL